MFSKVKCVVILSSKLRSEMRSCDFCGVVPGVLTGAASTGAASYVSLCVIHICDMAHSYVAVCCSVLQCVAVCCSMLQCAL